MNPDPSASSELIKAIPVVVGGLLATGGGVLGHLLAHRLNSKSEDRKLFRERIESLVKAIYSNGLWLDTRREMMIFRNADHDAPSPLDEAKMIQALHFPELSAYLASIQLAQLPLLKFINEQRISRIKDEQAWLKAWDFAPYENAYKNYILLVNSVTEKCRSLYINKIK